MPSAATKEAPATPDAAGDGEGRRAHRNVPRRGRCRKACCRQPLPRLPGFDIALAWQPSPEVSGDYFEAFPLARGQTALCIADVSGKGLAAARLAARAAEQRSGDWRRRRLPRRSCARRSIRRLCRPGGEPRLITMFYAVLDAAEKRLRYENAGHCLPLLVRAEGAVEFPASFSGVVGIFSHWLYQDQEVELRSGDCLLLVTDGLLQAREPSAAGVRLPAADCRRRARPGQGRGEAGPGNPGGSGPLHRRQVARRRLADRSDGGLKPTRYCTATGEGRSRPRLLRR